MSYYKDGQGPSGRGDEGHVSYPQHYYPGKFLSVSWDFTNID